MTPTELRSFRKSKRLNQADLAKELSVSRKTVINWETGQFAVPADIMDRLVAKGLMDAAPVNISKAEQQRVEMQRKMDESLFKTYKATRAFPECNTHAKTMALFHSQGHTARFTPAVQQMILAEFPDILTAPNGVPACQNCDQPKPTGWHDETRKHLCKECFALVK